MKGIVERFWLPGLLVVGSVTGILVEHLTRRGLGLYVGPIPGVWLMYLMLPVGLAWLVAELRNPPR